MSDEIETCPKCSKPLSVSGKDLFTQFIDVCQCGAVAEAGEATICNQCKKRINVGRPGSMTQWVFKPDFCDCAIPVPIKQSIRRERIKALAASQEMAATTKDNVPELPIEPGSFPLDRYKPVRELGHRGVGNVYLCKDRILEKDVVVKLLKEQTNERLIAFQEEARTCSRLVHPNILAILDFGVTESGVPYMVMEYFEAETLEKVIKRNEVLSIDDTIDVFCRITSALSYAHKQGVLHGHVNPGNILIGVGETGELNVRLIDFGTTLYFSTKNATIPANGPGYPNAASNRDYKVADELYSVGCVLFETLTGQSYFRFLSERDDTAGDGGNGLLPIRDLREDCTEALELVVNKSLSIASGQGYENAEALERELLKCRVADAVATTSLSSREPARQRRQARRARPAVVWIAVFSLLLIVGGVLFLRQTVEKPQSKPTKTKRKPARKLELEYKVVLPTTDVKNLEDVSISIATVRDKALVQLGKYPNLKSLTFHRCVFDGRLSQFVKNYQAFSFYKLRYIGLKECTVRSKDLRALYDVECLEVLELRHMTLPANAFEGIENSRIRRLNLAQSLLYGSAEIEKRLLKIKNLDSLVLAGAYSRMGRRILKKRVDLDLRFEPDNSLLRGS